jgi:CubicO group peptidase (beta-lactamase class C family)
MEEVRLDERKISELIKDINQGKYENVHSILIIRDRKLVFEEYFNGYTFDYSGDQFRGEYREFGIDTIHNLASVTKAYTSVLIGIAIEHGFIQSVHEKVFTYFPEYSHMSDENKDKITIEHLLTMTSGLEWNEGDVPLTDYERNDLIQLFIVEDPIEYILAKPVVAEPGKRFYYSGGDVNLLGEVIRKATGLRIDNFAEKYLFTPLSITEYEWNFLNPDVVYTSGDLKLRPRDMAKLGQLYLKDGTWNGERIISEEWIKHSTREYISIQNSYMAETYGQSYGYQWFLQTFYVDSTPFDSITRDGWGGQRIHIFPSLNMVVVLTGGNYYTEPPVNEIITLYILPSAK